MKKVHMILPLDLILSFIVGCQDKEAMAELEELKAQAEIEAQNKTIVRRFSDALNNQEFDLLDDLMVSDFVRHSQATPDVHVQSLEEFKQIQKQFLEPFPDQRIATEMLVAGGDFVAGYATYSGTQEGPIGSSPASGKKVEIKFLSFFRFEEGKIAELWVESDNLAMLTQLGHFPPSRESEK